jgi:sterol desaturase/sphingolipid hydroxylase (fatty acid hydroxylase superfamily)
MTHLLLFLFGFMYANFIEVFVHWFFLHKLGKKKSSIFSFHWKRHHRISRQKNMIDEDYRKPFYTKERYMEVLSLIILLSCHIPFLFVIPAAFVGMGTYLLAYYFIHKYCHYNTENAKKWFKGHYLHHMGKNQDSNWGTILPFADWILGTSYLNKRNK